MDKRKTVKSGKLIRPEPRTPWFLHKAEQMPEGPAGGSISVETKNGFGHIAFFATFEEAALAAESANVCAHVGNKSKLLGLLKIVSLLSEIEWDSDAHRNFEHQLKQWFKACDVDFNKQVYFTPDDRKIPMG